MFLRVFLLLTLFAITAEARDDAAIRDLAAGKRTEARADWWGFDPADATQAVQSAIDSRAKKVVIPNTGSPWNVRPIKLRSDQEIVLEKGVVLQALRGDFMKVQDMLLQGRGLKNVTLTGPGATLRMWKSDYQAPPYEKSEWRHGIGLNGCDNVTIRGLTVAESGGDGIYVGAGKGGTPCTKVTIQDVRCLNHHRQGISVISAEDLLIERCEFSDTAGTAPQAGIDFEPNSTVERLKNCILRDCTFNNNHSHGILFALNHFSDETDPLSVRVENCRTHGGLDAVYISTRNPGGVRGSVDFDHCHFEDSATNGLIIDNKATTAMALSFRHCKLVHLATEKNDQPAIQLRSRGSAVEALGGIVFEDCFITQKEDRKSMAFDDDGGVPLKDITGTLAISSPTGKEQRVELSPALLRQWFPGISDLKEYPRFDIKGMGFEPAFPDAHKPFPAFDAWQRGNAQFGLWGEQGGTLDFTLTLKPVGRTKIRQSAVRFISPSGKVINLPPLDGAEPRHYTQPLNEAGMHRLVVEAGSHTAVVQSATSPVCLVSLQGSFHFVWRAGPLYFLVPQGVAEFGIRAAGGGGTELVKATIKDAKGNVVHAKDNIGHAEVLPCKRDDSSHAEVWSISLDHATQGVLEDVEIMFEGVPPLLAASPETLLRPSGKGIPKAGTH